MIFNMTRFLIPALFLWFQFFSTASGNDVRCLKTTTQTLVHIVGPKGDIVPHGFPDWTQYNLFLHELRSGLPDDKIDVVFAGSSVTGTSFVSKRPFGDQSDYDISLASETLLERARKAGVQMRSKGTRTAPLSRADLQRLNLARVIDKIEDIAKREVNFMIYQTKEMAIERYGVDNVIVSDHAFYLP